MTFYLISPYKTLGFGYETHLQDLTTVTDIHKIKRIPIQLKYQNLKYYSMHSRYIVPWII